MIRRIPFIASECTSGLGRWRGCEQAEPLEAVAHAVALVVRRLDERQPQAADLVAEQVQRGLDRDRVRRRPGGARSTGAARSSSSRARLVRRRRARARTSSFTCGPTTCVWTQMPPTPPSSRNGQDRGRRRPRRGRARARRCAAPARGRRSPASPRVTFGISASSRDRLGLDVDDDAARDVVDDDRLVGRGRDRLEVRHDARAAAACCSTASRRGTRRRRARAPARSGGPSGACRRCRCRRRRSRGRRPRRRGRVELEPLVVGERRRLAGRAGDDEPVGAVVDEVARERAGSCRGRPSRPPRTASRSRSGPRRASVDPTLRPARRRMSLAAARSSEARRSGSSSKSSSSSLRDRDARPARRRRRRAQTG